MKQRRQFLRELVGAVGMAAAPAWAGSVLLTPRQSAGPFYPTELPLDNDNDLTRVAGQGDVAKGAIADLSGRILDQGGVPLRGVRMEIWQCDANGRYRHPRDPGRKTIDAGFQGFGRTLADDQGRYRFRTIRPVPYPGRTPHIHVAVYRPGARPFVTQLYVADEARNDSDFLYQRVPVEQRHLVTAAFAPSSRPEVDLEAQWDLILDVAPTA
jgi:protocatechuate 3,4-dioxygenase beta subunit